MTGRIDEITFLIDI